MSKRSSIEYAGKASFFSLYQSVKGAGNGASLREKAVMRDMVKSGVNGVALILSAESMQALLREHDELFTAEGEHGTRGWRSDMPYLFVMEIVRPYLIAEVKLAERWTDFPKIGIDRSAAWEQRSCELVNDLLGLSFVWTGKKKKERNGYYPDGIHTNEDGMELYLEAKGARSVFSCKGSITVKSGKSE